MSVVLSWVKSVRRNVCLLWLLAALLFLVCGTPLSRAQKHKEEVGLGLTTEIDAPEADVLDAVDSVVNNGIIQGSKEYNKDKYIEKASPADSSDLFPQWTGPGKVFFKVRTEVIDPRGFYESNDIGTLAVRYVVQSKDASHTILHVDAVFREDFRRVSHASDGSVEAAEFKDIQDHVDTLQEQKRLTAEGEKQRQEEVARRALEQKAEMEEIEALSTSENSEQALDEKVKELRRKAERLTKAPGAQLRSAPFHSATILKNLDPGLEVVILVKTSYWMGVETEEGEHGWIRHDQLEQLP